MRTELPVHVLKRQARLLSRTLNLPLHAALDGIAREAGYASWSLLVARRTKPESPAAELLRRMKQGDLALIAARPQQGKTLMGLEVLMEAGRAGRACAFFTLEYSMRDVIDRLQKLGADFLALDEKLWVDCSDAIDAYHIIDSLAHAAPGAVAVVDYLQLLDQKRQSETLELQISALKAFAVARGLFVIVLSQIDRSYDADMKRLPDAGDIRLPNPLDLGNFDWMCFLSKGEASVVRTRQP